MTENGPLLPTRLGNYELIRLLAQGGMADIYLARQTELDRYVAIKVLNAQRAIDPESCTLFLDEARLVGLLSHHNLASVFDVAIEGGLHYLAMEYVDGADLREVLSRAHGRDLPIAYDAALAIVAEVGAGLDYAHRQHVDGRPLGLVHRDVSLSNIMVTHDGAVKLIDFGIATSTASQHHTNPGIVRGKASYMSPEQCLGDPVDLRTDVFALGVVLYELTTGRRCFEGNSDFERMCAVVRGEYVPPTTVIPDFPLGLDQVIRTALALDPAERYPTAAALIEALEAVATLEGWRLGTRAIAAMMATLFGNEAVTVPCPPPAPALPPTKIMTRRRLARGTESDVYEAPPEPSDWQDEARTRGRRSLPRYFVAA